MKKLLCLLLAVTMLLTACRQEEEATLLVEEVPTEITQKEEITEEESHLLWASGVAPIEYEINWTVGGTTESYVRELTDEKYQGRVGGSEGNRLAADWIAEQFERAGLQKLPSLDSWKQNYETAATSVLDGEAFLVAPDGTEIELMLGEDWMFRASPEELDVTVALTTDEMVYKDGNTIWDACELPKGASRKLCLTVGEMDSGISYVNKTDGPSRILVTENVYSQLKQEGYRLHLKLPDAIDENGSVDNVVGYLPGKDSTKAVVLGADFDGPGQCGPLLLPGAYNNASGVATMIQTAEWLAKAEELPCDVIFVAFNTKGIDVMEEHIAEQYTQIRMVALKCIGWKEQPLTVYGVSTEATLRNSLAGGLELQYVDNNVGSEAPYFEGENMSTVSLFQDACLSVEEAFSVLNSTRDVADNLDFAMLDELSKKLATWVIERGDEPLRSYVVYW